MTADQWIAAVQEWAASFPQRTWNLPKCDVCGDDLRICGECGCILPCRNSTGSPHEPVVMLET
jgi:hypothetical protein